MDLVWKYSRPNFDGLSKFFGFPGLDTEERFIRLLAILGSCLTTPVLFTFGWRRLAAGDSLLGSLLIACALGFLLSILMIPRAKDVSLLVTMNLAGAGCLLIYLLAASGPSGHMAVWLYVYPPAVFFLVGLRKGSFLSALFLAAVVFVLLFQNFFSYLPPLDPEFSIRFFTSLWLVVFISFFYEFVRDRYKGEISKNQARLEEEKGKLLRAKRAAEAASRAKSDFLANMSHELRTPLNHIIGFTELINDKQVGELNEVQEEYLGDVLKSSRHLLSLINDILDLSKIEAGKLQMEISEVPLHGVLRNSFTMVKEKAMKHGIQLQEQIDGIPEVISADERKLKQVLYNLLANAVKFTPEGGRIVLGARPLVHRQGGWVDRGGRSVRVPLGNGAEGDWVEVWVRDTGIGLKPEDLQRIFAPFEQADNSASRKYQGTGLGLSLARQLVELHGGTIWAESAGAGKGATFSFVVPAGNRPGN
jgi:signal transduction histidine kinase